MADTSTANEGLADVVQYTRQPGDLLNCPRDTAVIVVRDSNSEGIWVTVGHGPEPTERRFTCAHFAT